jgi:hypothetical protein
LKTKDVIDSSIISENVYDNTLALRRLKKTQNIIIIINIKILLLIFGKIDVIDYILFLHEYILLKISASGGISLN